MPSPPVNIYTLAVCQWSPAIRNILCLKCLLSMINTSIFLAVKDGFKTF